MKAVEVKKDIYWVGTIDWNVRNFHGYLTQQGTTYNAYLIIDEKITLVDTAKADFSDELISRISEIIDPAKIDYIIANHVEMDHSGSLDKILELAPNAEIITCSKGEKGIKRHYKKDWNFKVINSGDSISLGKRSLQFITTPMVHWPDNMVAYMPEEKILFSNDSLGQHYASTMRFDDECDLDIVMKEAKKYYANIVMPYDKPTQNELAAVGQLDIEMVLPSHGIIWRKHLDKILAAYNDWAFSKNKKKVTIVYDSMWKSTEKMAKVVYEAFENKGYQIEFVNLQHRHISDIVTDVLDSSHIAVGSPTLNKNIMPSVAAFLTYLSGLSAGGKKAVIFGSYGWGDKSIPQLTKYMEEAKYDIIYSSKIQFIPDESELKQLQQELEALL